MYKFYHTGKKVILLNNFNIEQLKILKIHRLSSFIHTYITCTHTDDAHTHTHTYTHIHTRTHTNTLTKSSNSIDIILALLPTNVRVLGSTFTCEASNI